MHNDEAEQRRRDALAHQQELEETGRELELGITTTSPMDTPEDYEAFTHQWPTTWEPNFVDRITIKKLFDAEPEFTLAGDNCIYCGAPIDHLDPHPYCSTCK